MTKLLVVPLVVLLLTVLHGPSQAQALFFDFLPFSLGTSEPITLLLTGVTLLTLARIGMASTRSAEAHRDRLPQHRATRRPSRSAEPSRSAHKRAA
jgi:hypothetical protein